MIKAVNFTQAAPASTWTINHDFDGVPVIEVVLADGRVILPASIDASTPGTIVVRFSKPLAGSARLVGNGPYVLPSS